MTLRLIGPLAVALCVATPPLAAQAGDTVAARVVAPGVTYRHVADARGPWSMHVVTVDLRRPGLALRLARAQGALRGRERTSEMARDAASAGVRVLAAVNADFFSLATGENENSQVIDGEWWKGVKVADSPYDTFDAAHAQFGLDADGHPLLDRYVLDARMWAHGAATPLLTVNMPPSGTYEGSALYTRRFGRTTPRDTVHRVTEAAVVAAGRVGDTLVYVRRGPVSTTPGTAIPSDGAVISAYGARASAVLALAPGDTVKVLLATWPRVPHGLAPRLLVGGWPRILQDGEVVAADAATREGTISRNAELRHPRTAIGFSRDSATLYLLAVDGRSENSGGMTLVELATMMRRFGAWQAMNFDGGGSTTMVVDGALVNSPTDPQGERAVGSALLVVEETRRAP